MVVLITGGSGFVGLNLAEALLHRNERVILYSRKSPPQTALDALSALPGSLHVVAGPPYHRISVHHTRANVDEASRGGPLSLCWNGVIPTPLNRDEQLARN